MCRCCRRRTGAARGCIRAAISRAISRAGSKQKWLEVHGDTHFSHFYSELRRRPAAALLRPFPQGRGHRLGQAAEGRAQHPPAGREIHAARRERMAARAHAMDQVLSAARRPQPEPRAADGRDHADLRDDRRRPHVPDAADDAGDGDHRAGRGQAVRVVRHHRCRPVPGAAGVRSRTARRWCSSARNDPRTPVGLGWLRASHRKLDPRDEPALPAVAHP